jgi:perosamine synthetase
MLSGMEAVTEYRGAIGNALGMSPDRIGLFWKGRVALYVILKALGVGPGDEVILPAFTCVVVPNAVLYLGASPVYADIDAATFNIDPASVEHHLTSRTRVILGQNTFGLAPDLDALMAIAAVSRVTVVEDCAHGFGGTYRSLPNGTVADASFFSSQWTKPFSTGIGGFSAVRDPALAAEVREIERGLEQPGGLETVMLRGLLIARRRLLRRAGYWRALRLYRQLSKRNLVVGSSGGEELEGTAMPKAYAKALSEVQAKQGIAELSEFQAKLDHQRRIAQRYVEGLSDLDIRLPVQPDYASHTFLRFPILANERAKVMARAVERDLSLGDWFVSPVHPVTENLQAWGYELGSNPVAEHVCRHVVNLPTDSDIDEAAADRIIRFVHERHRDFEGVR